MSESPDQKKKRENSPPYHPQYKISGKQKTAVIFEIKKFTNHQAFTNIVF